MPSPHLPIRIGELNEAQQIQQFLASIRHLVWPDTTTPSLSIKITHLTMGTTNRVFKCSLQEDPDIILLRVYGESASLLVDRDHELAMITRLSDSKAGAHLYASFENGYVLEYLPGISLQPEDLANPYYCKLIAAKLATLHCIQQPQGEHISGKMGVWGRMHKWLDIANTHIQDPKTKDHLLVVSKEIQEVESVLVRDYGNDVLVFCHNDLNHANILYTAQESINKRLHDSVPTITFLDLEYADYDYRGFDLGNHFCEWSGLTLDFSKYPTKDQRREFLRHYLHSLKQTPPTDAEISPVLIEAERFAQVSHLLWHVWALVLAEAPNKAADFDYSLYASKRWAEYSRRKVELREDLGIESITGT